VNLLAAAIVTIIMAQYSVAAAAVVAVAARAVQVETLT